MTDRMLSEQPTGCVGMRSWRRQFAVLAIVTSWLSGCATVGSETGGSTVCPPVVVYSRAEQQRAAGEIASLPRDAVIVGWLSDYSVMREQARGCSAKFTP